MTPPAVEEHFSRTTLNGLLCEDFTACPMNSSLHLDTTTARTPASSIAFSTSPGMTAAPISSITHAVEPAPASNTLRRACSASTR